MEIGSKVLWTHQGEVFKGVIEEIKPDEDGTLIYITNIVTRTVKAHFEDLTLLPERRK